MNEFRCWIFAISDETGNSQFHSTGNSQCGFRAGRIFQVKIGCTANSQSLQSGAIILRQRDTIQSAQRHSLIKVTGGGPTLTFLPRVVQQLKMLPRAWTQNHIFGTLERA